MAKTMRRTNKVTKRERQRAAAEGRASARRKQARRRSLAYGLGAVGLLAVISAVDREISPPQRSRQAVRQNRVVLDNQDSHPGIRQEK